MEICSSHMCAVTQHHCTASKFRAKCSPHCSVLLCKTGSQQALCHCKHTCGDLLFTHVCSDPAPLHCIKVQGKMQSPLFSAALQNRLLAGSVHCKYTHGDLLFTHVCSDPAPLHCIKVQGKMQSPLFSAALQNRLTAGSVHCKYTHGDLLFTHVCSDPAPLHCIKVQGKMQSPRFSAALQNRLTAGSVSLQIHPWRSALRICVQ